MKRILILLAVLPITACSWGIKLDSGGSKMRVAWNDDVSRCRDLGKITVSVLNSVGPVDRSKIKVNDELEIMARNEAAGMGADTVKPLGDVRNGEQSWGAYACGSAAAPQRANNRPATRNADGVETFPIKGD